MISTWHEVEQAKNEKRCELVFSGPEIAQRIEKTGLDPGIFQVVHINFLEITKAHLKTLPPEVGQLINLTRMVISYNELSKLPDEIENLKKLKYLDISHNQITELPTGLSELKEMISLNVSSNQLSSLPSVSKMINLVTLNICFNKYADIPISLCDSNLVHFTDLIANNNSIAEIPSEIEHLAGLKVFHLEENALVNIPGELGNCTKLKEVNLRGNKLNDKRLLKLVDQCTVKQVMDYVRSHCPKSNADPGKQGKSKKKSKQSRKSESEEVNEILDELKILHVCDDDLKVITIPSVADIRPYIVCCKVQNVDLSDPSLMKKFIAMQTKLHDNICEKRTVATIATHDISKIKGNLHYDAKKPEKMMIFPLNRTKELTAQQLYKQLNDEADAVRKEKKKNSYSGIHKYLYLLKDKQLYPCLSDSSGVIVSFPPITNSDVTKMSNDTKDILCEVTGNNLNTCKKVMDALLIEMLKLGLGKSGQVAENGEAPSKNYLQVQQIKIVDEEGQLKVVYPSRTDIQNDNIHVIRA